jgi:hypothetical protein
MCFGYFVSMSFVYGSPRPHGELYWLLALPGLFQGIFALFTMKIGGWILAGPPDQADMV